MSAEGDADRSAHRSPEMTAGTRTMASSLSAGWMPPAARDGTIVATSLPTTVGDLGGATHITRVVASSMLTPAIVNRGRRRDGPRPRPPGRR